MKIFGFGAAGLDFRIQTADYGETYKDKLLAQRTMVLGGGAVANFLTQTARLGSDAAWLGKLGSDMLGKRIADTLKQENIDCSHIIFSDSECSPFNVAVYSGPEMKRRCGFMMPNSLAELTEDDLCAFSSAIRPNDYVMIEISEIPIETVLRFMRLIEGGGAVVAVDVDLDPVKQCGATAEQFAEICSLSDVIVPNIVSMASLYPGLDAGRLAERLYGEYRKTTVVSSGSHGAFYISRESGLKRCAPIDIEVIDTVGAGDAFHGGLIHSLSKGARLDKAVEFGCVCGGINCTAFGARTGMPDLKTASEYIERTEGRLHDGL